MYGCLPFWGPGLQPDWELNQGPFGLQACAQSTEPHHQGLVPRILIQTCCSSYTLVRVSTYRNNECQQNGGMGYNFLLPFSSYIILYVSKTRNDTSALSNRFGHPFKDNIFSCFVSCCMLKNLVGLCPWFLKD